MTKYFGTVSILVKDRNNIKDVNAILSEYHNIIQGRIGSPHHDKALHVIAVVMEGAEADFEAIGQKLEKLSNVTVKHCILACPTCKI